MMQINIDLAHCEGHGRCLSHAPEVFGYGDVTNQAYVLENADLASNRDAIMAAAEGCPEAAITVIEA